MANGTVFRKVASGFDIGPLALALKKHADIWEQIRARQETPGSPHSETKTIFLRWAPEQTVEAAFHQVEAVNYPALENFPEAARLIEKFCNHFAFPDQIGRVIITSLKPFGRIEPHIDEGAYPDFYQRFHIPISCGSASVFFGKVGEGVIESARMKPGELWWFDNKREHWVENMCDEPRVHLIFDAVVSGYEREYDKLKQR